MRLREVFDSHQCDRGYRHGYERVYEPLFEPIRKEPLRILEIGIFKGAGMWSWLDYFPNAHITGVDTFQRAGNHPVKPGQLGVLKDKRASWFRADSTKESVAGRYDIIIDDGCHKSTSQLATLRNYYPLLKKAGLYFIEDVWPERYAGWAELLEALPRGAVHHDLRGHPDSYIIQC